MIALSIETGLLVATCGAVGLLAVLWGVREADRIALTLTQEEKP